MPRVSSLCVRSKLAQRIHGACLGDGRSSDGVARGRSLAQVLCSPCHFVTQTGQDGSTHHLSSQ
jgi:hypothetical protein